MLKHVCLSFFITWKALVKAFTIAGGESADFALDWIRLGYANTCGITVTGKWTC